MYRSVPSLTIPGDSYVLTARGIRFSPKFLCLGGVGFSVGESFERKMQELLDLFKRNRRQLEKQMFLCCFITSLAKTVDVYCIFNNLDHFGSFRAF